MENKPTNQNITAQTPPHKKETISISYFSITLAIVFAIVTVVVIIALAVSLYDKKDEIDKLNTRISHLSSCQEDDYGFSNNEEVYLDISDNELAGETFNYSVTVNGVTLDDWHVFYHDDEEVYIIYDNYLPNSTNLAANAGLVQDQGDYSNFGVYSNYTETDFISRLNDTRKDGYWDALLTPELKQIGAKAKGGIDMETWAKSWNSRGYTYLDLSLTNFSDGTQGYQVNDKDMLNLSSDVEGYSDTLFFPRVNSAANANSPYYGYWIASPSSMNGYLMIATEEGSLGDNFHGFADAKGVGIRPVIIIPTDSFEDFVLKQS